MCELLKNHIVSDVGDGKQLNLDPRKVIAIVCDNASANRVMIEKLNRWLERMAKPKETPHKIYAVYCFAHVLHRIATVMLVYVNCFLGIYKVLLIRSIILSSCRNISTIQSKHITQWCRKTRKSSSTNSPTMLQLAGTQRTR
jgi:hypothetical protein